MPVIRFKKIKVEYLIGIAQGHEATPNLYYSPNWGIRFVFWQRLKTIFDLLKKRADKSGRCLDFGGGGGVFLPSLAALFNSVVIADLETKEAKRIVADFDLDNVSIETCDLLKERDRLGQFEAIVAADVLEHFQELDIVLPALASLLKPNGLLVTSLPTENYVYRFLRFVFNQEKPHDHYHSAYQVEQALINIGFEPIDRVWLPLQIRVFPLFRITAWRVAQKK